MDFEESSKEAFKTKHFGLLKIIVFSSLFIIVSISVTLLIIFNQKPASKPAMAIVSVNDSSSDSSQPVPEIASTVTISMCGDLLPHNTVVASAMVNGIYDFHPDFSEIESYLKADLSIADVEGPIDAFGNDKNLSSYPYFNYPIELLPAVHDAGINTLITANNHAFDKAMSGLVNSRNNIISSDITPIGTYETKEQYDTHYIKDYNGIKIGIVAYSASDNGNSPLIPAEKRDFVMRMFNSANTNDLPRMFDDIKNLRAIGAEFVIVSLHWGTEYMDKPTEMQRNIARQLIDNGADIIMGNHTHCVQPIEKYSSGNRNGLIIYSLGNLLTDQIALNNPKTQQGMLIQIKIKRDTKTSPVSIISSTYLPVFISKDSTFAKGGNAYGFKIIPAGKYAEANSKPDIFSTNAMWQKCKDTWQRVQSIVGTDATAITG
jgi:poly-gamma-glutamate capsule biosynthesis protein CapA/YwtB (metallophosphatase superfamily)